MGVWGRRRSRRPQTPFSSPFAPVSGGRGKGGERRDEGVKGARIFLAGPGFISYEETLGRCSGGWPINW
jgi:hypothetical protein